MCIIASENLSYNIALFDIILLLLCLVSQIDDVQREKILNLIDVGKKEGAKLCTGGGKMGDRGYYVQPTVFADVKDNMTISREEVTSLIHLMH